MQQVLVKIDNEKSLWLETFHKINSNDFDSSQISDKISIISEDDSATALLIEEAIKFEDNDNFRIKAVDIAFERAEYEIAEEHLPMMKTVHKKLRLARLCG